MIYRFGEYALDIDLYELRRADDVLWIEPQVFSLLTYLVEHHDRVVSREDLFTHLWPNRFIGNSALERCVMRARKAIGDSGGKQRAIKTFRSRGYRFLLPVTQSQLEPSRLMATSPPSLTHHALSHLATPGVDEPVTCRERQPPSALHHKQVTVLSCALASAEMLADTSPAEDYQALMGWFFTHVTQQVQAAGGLIAQFMDDSFLALFGTESPNEDHALQAVNIALALQHDLKAGPPGFADRPLMIRAGLHTGEVIGKPSGHDARVIYLAVGDTMQFAASLQACAEPGCILVSEVTFRLVHNTESGEVPGRLAAVKADPIPMGAYELYQ